MSVVSAFDWSGDGGHDFSHLSQDIFWIGPSGTVLGIPNTGGFIGALRGTGPGIYWAVRLSQPMWHLLPRDLSRSRAVERIMLSPEGHSLDKMVRLTRVLVKTGYRALNMSLHSPTVMPGGTSYTQNAAEVQSFLDKCRRYFDFFFIEIEGQSMTSVELRGFALRNTLSSKEAEVSSVSAINLHCSRHSWKLWEYLLWIRMPPFRW